MISSTSRMKVFAVAGALAATGLLAAVVTACSGREPGAASTAVQPPPPSTQAPPDSLGLALGALRAGQPQPAAETQAPELAAIPRITIDQLAAALDAGQAVVVDVRDDEQFDAAHITGAAHIRLRDIESQTARLPKDKLIALYCT